MPWLGVSGNAIGVFPPGMSRLCPLVRVSVISVGLYSRMDRWCPMGFRFFGMRFAFLLGNVCTRGKCLLAPLGGFVRFNGIL